MYSQQLATEYTQKAAELGWSHALYKVGYDHEKLYPDYRSVELYKIAARDGSSAGLYTLGRQYMVGRPGLPLDKKKGLKYLRLASSSGNIDAHVDLALFYINGIPGVLEKSTKIALYYLKAAYDKGNTLGTILFKNMVRDIDLSRHDNLVPLQFKCWLLITREDLNIVHIPNPVLDKIRIMGT